MNEPIEDAEFEAYIGRRSRLSHRYRELTGDLAGESPPKELDDAVLSLARSAHMLKRPETAGRAVYIGWMAPVAFAATIVLVFTVVMQIVIRPQLVAGGDGEADRRSAAAPASEEPFARQSQELAKDEKPAVTAAPPPVAEHRVAENEAIAATAVTALADAKVVAPQPERRVDSAESANSTAPAILAAPPAPTDTGEVVVTGARAEPQQPVSVTSKLTTRERMSVAAPKPDAADATRDPKVWLAEIERLRQSGQTAAADAEMKRFLERYPDYFKTHSPPEDAR